jgi:hypothetical protein
MLQRYGKFVVLLTIRAEDWSVICEWPELSFCLDDFIAATPLVWPTVHGFMGRQRILS